MNTILVETCPECGGDLIETVLTSYPPQRKKSCPRCGWSSKPVKDTITRVPYDISDSVVREADITKALKIADKVDDAIKQVDDAIHSYETAFNALDDDEEHKNEQSMMLAGMIVALEMFKKAIYGEDNGQ